MTEFHTIPTKFFDDHAERDLPTPSIIFGKPLAKQYVIAKDDPALPELINDAEFYADANGPDMAPPGLKQAAKALLKAVGR
jgi:hypothetical protein